LMRGVLAADQGTPKMIEIATAIQEGAQAYLRRQFKTIAVILIPLAIIVFLTSTKVIKPNGGEALSFGLSGTARTLAFIGGGIMSKAADVGADLVGKVEAGIPEDDPRNPATIADNVGDNVGDCAGMAADLFESYEVTLVASIILGVAAFHSIYPDDPNKWVLGLIFPLIARAVGVLASIVGIFAVRAREGETNALKPINRGFLTAGILTVIGTGAVALF